jgi:hypothetical protein
MDFHVVLGGYRKDGEKGDELQYRREAFIVINAFDHSEALHEDVS